MFAAIGHSVTGIHRASFGGLSLASLGLETPGTYILMTRDHLAILLENSAPTYAMTRSKRQLSTELPRVGRRIIRVREEQARREFDEIEAEEESEEYEGSGEEESSGNLKRK
jgi:hypothetical protein